MDELIQMAVAASVPLGVAVVLIALLGPKWIDAQFSRSIEKLRHENEVALELRRSELTATAERLKAELSGRAALVQQVGQRRFDLLMKLWEESSQLQRTIENDPRPERRDALSRSL